jgi:GT2 family glycosyltransferase
MSRVSVIIVNYNGQGLIRDRLKASEGQSFKDFKVVMVDNGSQDGSLLDIRRFLEESPIGSSVKLVPFEQNLGFAGGNVEGLRHADGEYIALLNNDAAPDKNWLGELVVAMDSDPMVGICASKLIVMGAKL